MKACTKCSVEKPLDVFTRDRTKRDGLNTCCRECTRARDRTYHAANREKVREYAHAYTKQKVENDRERRVRWEEENREFLEAAELKQAERRKKVNYEACARYARRHPEKVRQRNARREALKKGAKVGVVSYSHILERDGYVCHICSLSVAPGDVHFDHVIPLSRSGAHSDENIKVAHSLCNIRKGSKTVDYSRGSTDDVVVPLVNYRGGVMAASTSKKCTRCSKRRKVAQFYKDNSNKSGSSPWCKACERDYAKEYAARKKAEKGAMF